MSCWICFWKQKKNIIWVRSRNCGCLVTWFCYQLIAKPGNKTAAVSWPDPYLHLLSFLDTEMAQVDKIPPMNDKDLLIILHSQYYGGWCPGAARSYGISSYTFSIGVVCPEYFIFSARKVKLLISPFISWISHIRSNINFMYIWGHFASKKTSAFFRERIPCIKWSENSRSQGISKYILKKTTKNQ